MDSEVWTYTCLQTNRCHVHLGKSLTYNFRFLLDRKNIYSRQELWQTVTFDGALFIQENYITPQSRCRKSQISDYDRAFIASIMASCLLALTIELRGLNSFTADDAIANGLCITDTIPTQLTHLLTRLRRVRRHLSPAVSSSHCSACR